MSEEAQQIPFGTAVACLAEGEKISVHSITKAGNHVRGVWLRERAIDMLKARGAVFSGPNARAASHGIATTDEAGVTFFFETGHE